MEVQVRETMATKKEAKTKAQTWSALSDVFGRRGLQHFQLCGAVSDLSTFAAHFLEHLSSSFKLSLEMRQVCAHTAAATTTPFNPAAIWTRQRPTDTLLLLCHARSCSQTDMAHAGRLGG